MTSEPESTLEFSAHTNLSGTKISHYELLHAIGRGGMATVYRAVDTRSEQEIALKVLHPQLTIEPRIVSRFKREAQALVKLKHPSIVPILDYGQDDDFLYIAMPWLHYGSLADRINKGPVSPNEGARIISTVAQALHHAHHKGIIHRDVKPGNILLDKDGNALLSDFGLVMIDDSSLSLTGSLLVGTPAYMAPEQVLGEEVTPASDQYALGVVLYRMTTGVMPYESDTPMGMAIKHATEPLTPPRKINPNIPNAIEAVLIRALSKSPLDRYQSMLEFNEAFQEALISSLDPETGRLRKEAVFDSSATLEMDAEEIGPSQEGSRKRRWLLLGIPLLLFLLCSAGYFGSSMVRTAFGLVGETQTSAEATPNITRTAQAIFLALAPGEGTDVAQDRISTAVAETLAVLEDSGEKTPLSADLSASGTPGGTLSVMNSGTPMTATRAATSTAVTSRTADTDTPVPTDLPTTVPGEPTRTPSRTASLTPVTPPTSTHTATSVPTNTATTPPTNTATLPPTSTFTLPPPPPTHTQDVCSLIDFSNAGRNGQEAYVQVTNGTGGNIRVSNIYLNWPGSNGPLKKVELDGSELWSGEDAPVSANLASLGGVRRISAGSSKLLVFFFNNDAASSGYTLRITFDNGCVVEEDY